MVVTCESCESKFNLDDSLVKDSGSKVRCSHCQHVFTVFKPPVMEEETPALELEAGAEEPGDATEEEPLDFDLFESEQDEDEGISLEDFGLEDEPAEQQASEDAAVQEDQITPDDLGFGEDFSGEETAEAPGEEMALEESDADLGLEDLSLEDESPAEAEASESQEGEEAITDSEEELFFEDLTLEEEPGTEAEATAGEPEAALEGMDEDEGLSFDDLTLEDETVQAEGASDDGGALSEDVDDDAVLSFEEEGSDTATESDEEMAQAGASEEELEATGESDDLPDGVAVASVEDGDDVDVEEDDFDMEMPPPEIAEQATKSRRISLPLLICLVVALVGGGAFAAYTFLDGSNIKIPFLESIAGITGGDQSDPGSLQITLMEELITGEYVDNGKMGRLFVIKGKVRNNYENIRNFVRMKGVLYFRDGKVAQDKIVYCGNILSEAELKRLDGETIKKRLSNRFGDNKSNFKVTNGKVLPFMVVFTDVPEELGEFSVEVVDSMPG